MPTACVNTARGVALAGFPDRRLVSIAAASTYPVLMPLLGKRVRTDIVREHWTDIIRLVASVHSGHVAPSTVLKKLAAYERQNQLHLALQEVGKVERTLFMLDWLENPDLRRRCQAGLNKGEQRHALTGAICTFRQGRIADRTHEAQQYRASRATSCGIVPPPSRPDDGRSMSAGAHAERPE